MPATVAEGFDHASYPHLMSMVLDHADPDVLLALRGTSKALREAADARLFGHVVVGDSDGYTSRGEGYPVPIRSALVREPGTESNFGTWAGGWGWASFSGGWGAGLPGAEVYPRAWWSGASADRDAGQLAALGERIKRHTRVLDIRDASAGVLSFLSSLELHLDMLRITAGAYPTSASDNVVLPASRTLVIFPPPPLYSLALTALKNRPYVYPLAPEPFLPTAGAAHAVHHIHFAPESVDLVFFSERFLSYTATASDVFVFAPPLDPPLRASAAASEPVRASRFSQLDTPDPDAAAYVLAVRTRQWGRVWRDAVACRVHAGRKVTLVDLGNAAPSVWTEPCTDPDDDFAARLVEGVGAAITHYRAAGWTWGGSRAPAVPAGAEADAQAKDDIARLLRFVSADEYAHEVRAEVAIPLRLEQHAPRKEVGKREPGERGYREWAWRDVVNKAHSLPDPFKSTW
ncbi:uncharacterized protein LOC62_02G002569 [Vanrija pseudolonga]|uniref:Uncharacterized protein n=1 Tax=Vanrija pseudolonga TaxID=143232 RepID=A0AAF1BGM1_9TREE|nr:hypothetical protein LOC62_02G002569 [Vanrija pseudolonga]